MKSKRNGSKAIFQVDQLKLNKSRSYGNRDTGNSIIHGNNIDVLEVLKESLFNQVRCIYIDPPYNNNEEYIYYDDKGHGDWLNTMKLSFSNFMEMLRPDGSIWISIDDTEVHYLKVAADEIFGRDKFITTVIWQHRTTRENRSAFSNNHEYVLVYAKEPKNFRDSRNQLPPTEELLTRYKNPDNDSRGPWQSISANVQNGHATPQQFYTIISPITGKEHFPPPGRCWVYPEYRMIEEIELGNIWFGKDGNGVPRVKKFLKDANLGLTPETLWLSDISGTNKSAKKHQIELMPSELPFDTPKPEELLRQILCIATDEGDLVLDSFLGSGTTASVAHKMGRKYIGIEINKPVIDYAAERIKKVVKGEGNGISDQVGWKGGGGFNYYKFI